MTTIYDNIKRICSEKGIAVSQLEKDVGLERSNVYKWKETDPGSRRLKAVALYLEVTVDDLLADVPEWEGQRG